MFVTHARPLIPGYARTLSAVFLLVLTLAMTMVYLPQFAANPSIAPRITVPLQFVPNIGQQADEVRFQSGAMGGTLLFSPDAVTLALPDVQQPISVRFEGVNANPALVGAEQQSGRVHYLVGEPSEWQSDLPMFAHLEYRQLYDGIDLQYEGVEGSLKGTYFVAPGADPSRIRWSYSGVQGVRIDQRSGDLKIDLPAGSGILTLTEQAPIAWQDIDGRRVPVAVRYDLASDGQVGFVVGQYDANHALTIDPYLVYSTFVGGSDIDEGRDIAVDAHYVTGSTRSNNLPNAKAPQASYAGPNGASNFGDAYVMKLNAAGTALIYITYLGGSGQDVGDAITVDSDGNAYVTGMTESTNFPTKNAFQPAPGGNQCSSQPCSDAFVTKLNAAGNAFVFSSYLGGSRNENTSLLDTGTRSAALGIALDANRNVYVTGMTESTNFPTKNAAYNSHNGLTDIFLTKVQADGSALLYSTYIGGGGADYSGDVAVSDNGMAYIVGRTLASNYPTKNAFQSKSAGDIDIVISQFDTTKSGSSSLVYSTYFGGSSSDAGMGIRIDAQGNMYIAGFTQSLNFPVQNAFQTQNGSAGSAIPRDAIVAKLSADGKTLLYSTYLGGEAYDVGYGLEIDKNGTMFIVGNTDSNRFPTKNAWQVARADVTDVFVARIDPSKTGANSLLYSTYLGGTDRDYGYGVAVDSTSHVYVTGMTGPADLYKFPNTTMIGSNGATLGIFITKLSPNDPQRVYLPMLQR